MSISRAQQILLKRGQQQAAIDDVEYRATLAELSGHPTCTSSTDPRLTERNVDILMSYFEAIYFRKLERNEVAPPDFSKRLPPVFQEPGYWANKNRRGDTSRDRYTQQNVDGLIANLEGKLRAMGYGPHYYGAIRRHINPFNPWKYKAALERTIASKSKLAPGTTDAFAPSQLAAMGKS